MIMMLNTYIMCHGARATALQYVIPRTLLCCGLCARSQSESVWIWFNGPENQFLWSLVLTVLHTYLLLGNYNR